MSVSDFPVPSIALPTLNTCATTTRNIQQIYRRRIFTGDMHLSGRMARVEQTKFLSDLYIM